MRFNETEQGCIYVGIKGGFSGKREIGFIRIRVDMCRVVYGATTSFFMTLPLSLKVL
jgi:hypothetical protein